MMRWQISRRPAGFQMLLVWGLALSGCARTDWVEFRSDEGRFVAVFPRRPAETNRTVNTEIGPQEMRQYSITEGQRSFSVAIADYPVGHVETVGPTAVLDHARDGAVINTQGKLLSELIIEMNGHPGRQFKIGVAGGKATINAKIFLVKNRIYQILVVTPVEDSYSPQVSRFLDSFDLLR